MCENNISLFSETKMKRCRHYEYCKKKKSKENLNWSESDQQTSTAFPKITTNKDPSTGFATQQKSSN